MMILLVLSLVLVALSILEKLIYRKKNKDWDKFRLFIAIIATCLLFSISYLITDTAIGVVYVFSSIITFILVAMVNNRSNIEWLKCSSHIIGLPAIIYLLIKATQNMLINPQSIFLLLLIMSFTVNYSPLRKWTKKENIALGTGIAFAALIMFSYYKLSGHGDRIMLKQEIVAQNYLEEELAMDGFEVYAERYNMKLRGEDAIVRAYDSSDTFIIMVYNKNKIISYEIKDN